MNTGDYIIAVDAGTANVVVMAGQQSEDGRVELVTGVIAESEGLMRGDIKNIESSTKAIKTAIENIEDELGIEVKDVVVGVSGSGIKCRKQQGYVFVENNDGELGEVKESDLQALGKTIRNAQVGVNESIIHISAQSYTVDDEQDVKEPIGMMGKKLEAEFNIITNDKDAMSRMEKCLARVGVKPVGYVLNGIAAADAILTDDEKELGVVVVDIGAGTADVTVYYDNIVRYVAVIPIGGELVNRDICQTGVLKRSAEDLKLRGVAMYEKATPTMIPIQAMGHSAKKVISQRNLSMIIEARLMDIIEATQNELNKSGYAGKLEAGVVLTGGTSRFDYIDELFAKYLNMPVRVATHSPNVVVGENTFYNDPCYLTAMGIIAQGIKQGWKTYTKPVARVEKPEEQPPIVIDDSVDDDDDTIQQGDDEKNNDVHPKNPEDGNKPIWDKIREWCSKWFEVVDDTKDNHTNDGSSNYRNL